MKNTARILLVEDDLLLRKDVREVLLEEGYEVHEAGDGISALTLLRENSFDLMILDLGLPRLKGMEVLKHASEKASNVPVIVITGMGSVPKAVEAIKLGAYDFLEKPFDVQRTKVAVRNALEKVTLQREKAYLVEEAKKRYQMLGTSPVMQKVYRLIDKAAKAPSRVLILGESGSGKELIARAIHANSLRAANPFVALNCAAIPEALIESELFGHEKGAFTGAHAARDGTFFQADGGTLFLDEVGDMSLSTQAKTLRALEEGRVTPIGGRMEHAFDVRVIAATNKDLVQEINDKSFREDLYYRLGVITIHVPPLRNRREDIPLLIKHFLNVFETEHAYPKRQLTQHALQILLDYKWPGNVRQLRNSVERLVVLSDHELITEEEMLAILQQKQSTDSHIKAKNLREAREGFERQFILNTLIDNDWKIQDAAAQLGIDRTYLWKKMQKFDLRADN